MTDLFHDSDPETRPADDVAGARSQRARTHRRREQKRRTQRRRTLVTFVVMVLALALLVAGAWIFIRPLFSGTGGGNDSSSLSDYPGPGSGSAEIVVASGDSGAMIGQTLVAADVVASVDAFVAAYNANSQAAGIQPGTYTLTMQIPATDAVAALVDPANRTGGLTIPEGWRATQIYERVAEVLGVTPADVEAAAAQVTLPAEAGGAIEGWLFPSTYTPASDATPVTVLQAMVDQTVAVLERNGVPRERWHDVIILASIIEREVSFDDDRAAVSRVFYNRLDGACPDTIGRLQSDTTLVYELQKPHDEITVTEWQTPTPYNTRVNAGLPPTAISSPGESSIQAALSPADGDWCYFITVNLDTGETKFTASYDEFLVFRQEYQDWVASQETGD